MDWSDIRHNSRDRLLWWLLATAAAAVAGVATRQLMFQGYRITSRGEAPDHPASRETSWTEALLWAAVCGFVVAIGRVIAHRLAANAWEYRTGHRPPGLG